MARLVLLTCRMRHHWQPAACLVPVTLLVAGAVSAQPAPAAPVEAPAVPPAVAPPAPAATVPETLETPYSDLSPTAPPTAVPVETGAASQPAARIKPAADTRPLAPIRARRRLALTGELGWNGLAGFGPVLTYHLDPHFSLDMGAGISLFGWKVGARGRYNLLKAAFTPFVGAGFNATTGLGEQKFDDFDGDPMRGPVTLRLEPSYLTQLTFGFDYVHERGFTLVGALGYSILLNEDNMEVLAGSFTDEEQRGIDIVFKSGVVISAAVGYSFE